MEEMGGDGDCEREQATARTTARKARAKRGDESKIAIQTKKDQITTKRVLTNQTQSKDNQKKKKKNGGGYERDTETT